MESVIHGHFKISKGLYLEPARFKNVNFRSIPFFKIYDQKAELILRETILGVKAAMPHRFQKIFNEIRPPKELEDCHYRVDLVPLTYCRYNQQSFFVRVYQLRANNFIKVEVVLHSDTLGAGKYLELEKIKKNIERFFKVLEGGKITAFSPLGEHRDDFFFYSPLKEQVGLFDKQLERLKNCSNERRKGVLIEEFKKDLREFERNAKQSAERLLREVRVRTPP